MKSNTRPRIDFVTAAVLAGGKSSRMGFDKQLLEIDRKKIYLHTAENLLDIFGDVLFVTETPDFYKSLPVRTCSDIYKGMGPVGGIHSALNHTENQYIFLLACDMPVVCKPYIDYMLDQALGFDACVTLKGGRYEPFCAFYSKRVLPELEQSLSRGKTSLYYFLQSINTKVIPEEQARAFSPDLSMFTNLNTPEDYEKYLRREL